MVSHIVLNKQQAELLSRARKTIQVLDQEGRLVGFFEPAPSEAEIARARASLALQEPEYNTADVLEHMRSLEKR